MKLTVKFFAALRDTIGAEEIAIDWRSQFSCGDMLTLLKDHFRETGPLLSRSLIAVNGEHAKAERILLPEDEVAILPPVSGG